MQRLFGVFIKERIFFLFAILYFKFNWIRILVFWTERNKRVAWGKSITNFVCLFEYGWVLLIKSIYYIVKCQTSFSQVLLLDFLCRGFSPPSLSLLEFLYFLVLNLWLCHKHKISMILSDSKSNIPISPCKSIVKSNN